MTVSKLAIDGKKSATRYPSPPAYQRIEEDMRARVRSGDWAAGGMIPSRKNLARDYGVSLMTVERAVSNLLSEGVLKADGRTGTFVTPGGVLPRKPAPLLGLRNQPPERIARSMAANTRLGIVAACKYTAQTDKTADMAIRPIINALERVFSDAGGTTRFFNRCKSGQAVVAVADALESLLQSEMDAVVIVDYHNDLQPDDPVYARIQSLGLPLVVVAAREIPRPIPHVFMDNVSAGYQAAQHLMEAGCRTLTVLAPFQAAWLDDRIMGVQNAMTSFGRPQDTLHLYPGANVPASSSLPAFEAGYVVGGRLFQSGMAVDGVIAATDLTAHGFLQAAREAGRLVGRDFALVGFDDAVASPDIGLTSVRPPFEALGAEAAHLIQRALQGENIPLQVRINGHLLVRHSSQLRRDRLAL